MNKEEQFENKVMELIEISGNTCLKYKKDALIDIVKTLVWITADECCDNCCGCRELNGCVLTKIKEGKDNIFGTLHFDEGAVNEFDS